MRIILPRPVFYFERWKYSRFFGVYVSNQGHFKDKDKNTIKPNVNDSGYLCVPLKHGFALAHRIVAMTWLPVEDMMQMTVDHLDHNKRNNAVSNLEWVTEEENLARAKNDFVSKVAEKVLTATVIKMYSDAEYKECIKEFKTIHSAANYLKSSVPEMKGNTTLTEERIATRICQCACKKKAYANFFWEV